MMHYCTCNISDFKLKNIKATGILLLAAVMFLPYERISAEGEFFWKGTGSERHVAVTFDDGPGPATEEILSILKEYEIPAAFFMIGREADKRRNVVKTVQEHGHEICTHTYEHKNLYPYGSSEPREVLKKDIEEGMNILFTITGSMPRYVRIPYGYFRPWVREVAQELKIDVVHWSFGCDWQKMTEEEMLAGYLAAVQPGAILLFHDGGSYKNRKKTITILPAVIQGIKEKGYRAVPLRTLLKHP